MKFLIQTINNKVVHDFAFTLLQAIEFQTEFRKNDMSYTLTDEFKFEYGCDEPLEFNGDDVSLLKEYYKEFTPVGSVEFVCNFIKFVYGEKSVPKPTNIPEFLLDKQYTKRFMMYTHHTPPEIIHSTLQLTMFFKSANVIKATANGMYHLPQESKEIPEDDYLVSEYINIETEYRCFIYNDKLVGLQWYSGDFTMFPDVDFINKVIKDYEATSPVAYTLDVGCNKKDGTFIIEIHDFFSCGLYGFSDYNVLPYMLHRWFHNYITKNPKKITYNIGL